MAEPAYLQVVVGTQIGERLWNDEEKNQLLLYPYVYVGGIQISVARTGEIYEKNTLFFDRTFGRVSRLGE